MRAEYLKCTLYQTPLSIHNLYIGLLQLNSSHVFPFSLEKRAVLVPHLSLPPSRCESSQTSPQEKKPNKRPKTPLFQKASRKKSCVHCRSDNQQPAHPAQGLSSLTELNLCPWTFRSQSPASQQTRLLKAPSELA